MHELIFIQCLIRQVSEKVSKQNDQQCKGIVNQEVWLYHGANKQRDSQIKPLFPCKMILIPINNLKCLEENRKTQQSHSCICNIVPRLCDERSFIKESNQRAMLGALLNEYPLSIDTLASNWNKNLSVKEIPARYQIRYIYTDLDLNNDTVFSVVNNRLHYDSLSVNYLGFRCEHELTAFVSYPHWLLDLSWDAYVWLIAPWIFLVLLVVFYTPIEYFYRSKFIKEKIVEKEIHVADVEIEKAKTFRLQDGSLFDTFSGTLTKGGLSKQLPPQSVLLLKLFLRKENHHLSPSEIDQELWKGQGTTDQLHKAIKRLRTELKKVSSEVVVKSVNGDYELKQPISSKNLEKETTDED